MNLNSPFDSQTDLQFPLLWHGRLITISDAQNIPQLVQELFRCLLLNGQITQGRRSGGDRYRSWQLSATLPDRPTMEALFHGLEEIPGVRMLI